MPLNRAPENVWDYPRPPRLEPVPEQIRIVFNGVEIARTSRAYRVLETSHPPTYYLPPEDVNPAYLRENKRASFCEWKGQAGYVDVVVDGNEAVASGWRYLNPTPAFAPITGYLAFYASKMDACYVGEEQVTAQPGDFYGGWMTSWVTGKVKGGPGTWGW